MYIFETLTTMEITANYLCNKLNLYCTAALISSDLILRFKKKNLEEAAVVQIFVKNIKLDLHRILNFRLIIIWMYVMSN